MKVITTLQRRAGFSPVQWGRIILKMSEAWNEEKNWHPDYYPRPLFEDVPSDKPQSYITRKKYKDGVRVLIDHLGGDTITIFLDGGVHRENPDELYERYKEPPAPK